MLSSIDIARDFLNKTTTFPMDLQQGFLLLAFAASIS